MEDDSFLSLAVFDGHDGASCSSFLSEKFFSTCKTATSASLEFMASLFREAEEQCVKRFAKSGSCAAAVVIDKKSGLLVSGNVGDCMVVLGDTLITVVHRADDAEERARIEKAGGWISDGRVFGVLQPSRTLGDKDIKKSIPPPPLNRKAQKELKRLGLSDERQSSGSAKEVVVALPHLSVASLPANEVLVAGSDGLFDLLPAKQCVKIARAALGAGKTAEETAKELCAMARARKSRDDISAVVVMAKAAAAAPAVVSVPAPESEEKKADESTTLPPPVESGSSNSNTPSKKKKKNKKRKSKKNNEEEARELPAPTVPAPEAAPEASRLEFSASVMVVAAASVVYAASLSL